MRIFFTTLSQTVNLPYPFTSSPVKHKNITIHNPVCNQQNFLAGSFHNTLSYKIVSSFQRNVFHIHKILKDQFLFRIIRTNINRDAIICQLFISSTSCHYKQRYYQSRIDLFHFIYI